MNREPDNLLTFYVNPAIPHQLKKLEELSNNLWSTWDKNAIRLFNRIDPIVYRKCNHNPVMLLHLISEQRLQELCEDKGFLSELDSVYESFLTYMSWKGYYFEEGEKKDFQDDDLIAYFSMEYGLHESIPIYSGGLGVLSGDHIKAASDQAIPLVAFGLLYKYGYFTQYIDINGEQSEEWKENQWHLMPVSLLTDDKGDNLIINVKVENESINIKVWTVSVGQIKLYLLDTDFPQNSPFVRSITNRLYDADRTIRLLQEIVLSFGAMELMSRLNIKPKVYHLNEGHSAFLIIDRLSRLIKEDGYTFEEAAQITYNSTVFTTHTPVSAGNEHFKIELVKRYLESRITSIGLTFDEFLKFATIPNDNENFWLPALALRFSRYVNGVSKIHSETSKKIWRDIFPNLATDEIPIDFITNGVHTGTWLGRDLSLLFDRYIGEEYLHMAEERSIWQNVAKIPDIEIWQAHQRRKEQMISFIRQRIEQSIFEDTNALCAPLTPENNSFSNGELPVVNKNRNVLSLSDKLKNTLSPEILTIGFARRFAPYKRANILLENPERLLELINHPTKPVQFVFAGKAHPADSLGKSLIKNIVDFARIHDIEDRFLFVEDYDINVAKHLVQGVDVWLNTPIKPQEASATSGMKAGLNGVLNLSVLDGWWPECYDGDNGWAIISIENPNVQELCNKIEASQIYDLIEGEISDLYYTRNESNLPIGWLTKMKHSIYTVGKGFNLHRMLRQYTDKFYIPAAKSTQALTTNNNHLLKETIRKEKQVVNYWGEIYIKDFHLSLKKENVNASIKPDKIELPITTATTVNNGDTMIANCYVFLNSAPAELFTVELFYKELESSKITVIKLDFIEKYEDNVAHYRGEYKILSSGLHGVNIRLRADINSSHQSYNHLVKWKPV